jgi:hypothetical protein
MAAPFRALQMKASDSCKIQGLACYSFSSPHGFTAAEFLWSPTCSHCRWGSCFGKLITAIPFLLESQQIPTDFFQLWLMAGVFSSRIGDLLGCSHLLAFTILTTSAMRGLLRIQWHKLMVMFVSTVMISALTIIGIRLFVG